MKRVTIAAAIAISGLIVPVAASAQSSYEGAGETGELDCDGGTATINGASNDMTVTGRCKQLVIEGASNRVRVDLASKGLIRIVGAGNRVQWTTPDGSRAQVRITGADNRVSMAR